MSEKKNDTFNVSGEVVKEALEREVAKGNLTEAQKDLIWWFFCLFKIQRLFPDSGRPRTQRQRVYCVARGEGGI